MGLMRRVRRSLFTGHGSFDEESRFHIDHRTDDYIRSGLNPDEARRAAMRRFGSVPVARERTNDADLVWWIDDLRRDLGYGLRMLWRSPGPSLLAILCLTLAIGATAAVFRRRAWP
jgi:hypothetical protein